MQNSVNLIEVISKIKLYLDQQGKQILNADACNSVMFHFYQMQHYGQNSTSKGEVLLLPLLFSPIFTLDTELRCV